jgi:hypothetical protein
MVKSDQWLKATANGIGAEKLVKPKEVVYVKGIQHDSLLYNKYAFVFVCVAFLTDKSRMEYEGLYEAGTFFNKTISR